REAERALGKLRAWALALIGDHRGGIDAAELASGPYDPEGATLLARLAALALRRQDREAAERALILSLRADPRPLERRLDLAALQIARGRSEAAIQGLRTALASTESPALERALAGALLASGRAAEATRRLAQRLERCPEPIRCHLDLARAALEAGELRLAQFAARRAHALAENDSEPLTLLGLALAREGQRQEARRAFERALQRAPGEARARAGLRGLEP
ncbi:MAG: hypothetical protein OEY14_16445, partial [Myxococcales bacterium]|nr:hypothetical protein [Myxococcales bacterium]